MRSIDLVGLLVVRLPAEWDVEDRRLETADGLGVMARLRGDQAVGEVLKRLCPRGREVPGRRERERRGTLVCAADAVLRPRQMDGGLAPRGPTGEHELLASVSVIQLALQAVRPAPDRPAVHLESFGDRGAIPRWNVVRARVMVHLVQDVMHWWTANTSGYTYILQLVHVVHVIHA